MEDKRIIIPGKVLDNKDPMMLGRIRVFPYTTEVENQAYPEGWEQNKENWLWTKRDPFVFLPLIPYYVNQVPEVDEYVNIVYVTRQETKDANKFYIQGPITRPWNNTKENFKSSEQMLSSGDYLKSAQPIRNKVTGEIEQQYKGLYPEPGDNAFISRGTTDLILKKNDVLLRAGKYTKTNGAEIPTPYANRSFVQLSNYELSIVDDGTEEVTVLNFDDTFVKIFLEWNVNPIVTLSGTTLDGYVRLNSVKETPNTLTSVFDITTGSTTDTNPIPGSRYDFTGYTRQEVINLVNRFIKGLNDGWINLVDLGFSYPLGGGVGKITNQFPFVFGPSIVTDTLRNSDDPEIFNTITEIYNNIKFNPADSYAGFGLLWNINTVGRQTTETTQVINKIKYNQTPITYGVMGGDFLYLLSHNSQIPDKIKVDLKDTLYGITQEQFIGKNGIKENTNSMVRGEKLIELLEQIITFLTSHTHAFPGLPPIQEPKDSVTVTQLESLIGNAKNTILNQNIRIN